MSSAPAVHILDRTSGEYSDRSGMGLTSTSLLMLTRRRVFFLLDDAADLPEPLCKDRVLEWHRERAPVH